MHRKLLPVAALVFAFTASVHADDQVFRKGSGKALRGAIQGVSREAIDLKPRTGEVVKVPADEISRVRFDGEPAALNLARSNEESGLLQRALESYTELLPQLKGPAKTDTEFLIARTKAKIAVADPTKVEDAAKALEDALAAASNSFRYYECVTWLGRVAMASGDYPAARARFDTLAKSPLRSHQMAAKVATGKVLLAQDKADEALASFDEVAAMTPSTPSEIATRFDALVGKAQCQRKQGALQEAVVTLNEILDKTTADESDLRARAYLLIGDCYRDQQQPKKAVMAYLHVDLLYDREKAAHAESLYQLAQVWPAAGHPERGAEAASRLRQLYPNNGWTKKLGGA